MASLYKKPVVTKDPVTGEKVKGKSKKWWGQYKDASGQLRRHPWSVDKAAAKAMLNEIVARVEREKAGLIDPTEQQRKRPLSKHLAEFKDYLENKGVTEKQIKESTRQIEKMIKACRWKKITQITPGEALEFLGRLRRRDRSRGSAFCVHRRRRRYAVVYFRGGTVAQ